MWGLEQDLVTAWSTSGDLYSASVAACLAAAAAVLHVSTEPRRSDSFQLFCSFSESWLNVACDRARDEQRGYYMLPTE